MLATVVNAAGWAGSSIKSLASRFELLTQSLAHCARPRHESAIVKYDRSLPSHCLNRPSDQPASANMLASTAKTESNICTIGGSASTITNASVTIKPQNQTLAQLLVKIRSERVLVVRRPSWESRCGS